MAPKSREPANAQNAARLELVHPSRRPAMCRMISAAEAGLVTLPEATQSQMNQFQQLRSPENMDFHVARQSEPVRASSPGEIGRMARLIVH
jgi:hypothetical protein